MVGLTVQPAGRIRCRLAALLLLVPLSLSACIAPTSYVDPDFPQSDLARLAPNREPKPVALLVEFKSKGATRATATQTVRSRIFEIMGTSKQFGAIEIDQPTTDRRLFITIDNVGDTGDAKAKGFATGLTLGLVGNTVTDLYVMQTAFQVPGRPPINGSYKHALHTTIGNASGPPGLQGYTIADAFNRVLDQLIAKLITDLAQQGAL
jgi:hypothetical protein